MIIKDYFARWCKKNLININDIESGSLIESYKAPKISDRNFVIKENNNEYIIIYIELYEKLIIRNLKDQTLLHEIANENK